MSRSASTYPAFPRLQKDAKFFGGSLLEGKRKSRRGIQPKKLYHLVLRARDARGSRNMLKRAREIRRIVGKQGRLHFVEILDFANVGNHLHLLVRPRGSMKSSFGPFLRSISGLIARKMLGAEKGSAKGGGYWAFRPYSRLVHESRKSFGIIKNYFVMNKAEAMGTPSAFVRSKQPAALAFLSLIKQGPP